MKMTVASFASRLEKTYDPELLEKFRNKFPSLNWEITSDEGFRVVGELLHGEGQNQLDLGSLALPTNAR
ncbi:MAG: hypothetical protein WCS89_01575 [Candidatus Paceibacterota bacterium]